MKVKTIMAKQAQQNVKFETAKKIREMLDAARKEFGADEWDSESIEEEIATLVFDEDE